MYATDIFHGGKVPMNGLLNTNATGAVHSQVKDAGDLGEGTHVARVYGLERQYRVKHV